MRRPRVDPVRYEARLVDEHDLPVPPGTPGELVLRRLAPVDDQPGYKNMRATARAWRNGWFHTGDQFTEDDDGNYYFQDRVKDAIRRRGEHLVLRGRGGDSRASRRRDVAVAVANPDVTETTCEEVKAVIVPGPGTRSSRPSWSRCSPSACPTTGYSLRRAR